MARSDLLINLIEAGTRGDAVLFRRTAEALVAEERAKQHHVLAEQLQRAISNNNGQLRPKAVTSSGTFEAPVLELTPRRSLKEVFLPDGVRHQCEELIEEQNRVALLRSYNLEPRHKIMISGPPGNGKTTLAEALAYELSLPLFVVRYEAVIGSYLGETAARLDKVFTFARTRNCVLFFDEFDTIGKERGDTHETGEIKRVVSSLLLQIDQLPSNVVVVAATNHSELLDRAAWRRFEVRLSLPAPERAARAEWFRRFSETFGLEFGYSDSQLAAKTTGASFAQLEQFSLDILRRRVLNQGTGDTRAIVTDQLKRWSSRVAVVSQNSRKSGKRSRA